MIKRFFLICVIFPALLFAQDKYKASFQLGKSYFVEGSYEQAIESLEPALEVVDQNPYGPYAYFYSGVAAYRTKKFFIAKYFFKDLLKFYPRWEQKQEAIFWLTLVCLKTAEWENAEQYREEIDDKDLLAKLDRARQQIFAEQVSDSTLLEWYEATPEDSVVAKILAQRMVQKPSLEQDVRLLSEIVKRHNFSGQKYGLITQIIKKDTYRVAVLMPFLFRNINLSSVDQGNQFIIDFYQGLLMAADSLRSRGMGLEIYPYDTRASLEKTEELLQLEELKTMDLVIGPVYPAPLRLVNDYCRRNKINQINPFSHNHELIEDNPYAFLVAPSRVTEGHKAAELALATFDQQKVAVFPEWNKDTLEARLFCDDLQEADTAAECQIFNIDEEEPGGEDLILNMFTEVYQEKKLTEEQIEEKDYPKDTVIYEIDAKRNLTKEDSLVIQPDSIKYIFVPTDNPVIVGGALSMVSARHDTIGLIGRGKWLDFKFIQYEQLSKPGIYFLAPDFIDFTKESFIKFKNDYTDRYNRFPNTWSYKGYDVLLYFGGMMQTYGKYFQAGIYDHGFEPGLLFDGFNYDHNNDNQHIPIVQIDGITVKKVQYEEGEE